MIGENNDNIKYSLNKRTNHPDVSIKMRAMVGFMIGAKIALPLIEQMKVKDGVIFARVEGDSDFNDDMGSLSDFKNSWNLIVHSSEGLSEIEIKYLNELPSLSIRGYGE